MEDRHQRIWWWGDVGREVGVGTVGVPVERYRSDPLPKVPVRLITLWSLPSRRSYRVRSYVYQDHWTGTLTMPWAICVD
jgi:hypothetical protein